MSADDIVKGLMEYKFTPIDNSFKNKKLTEYQEWVKDAESGDHYIYHKGLSPTESFIGSILARKVMKDYEKGLVHPFSIRQAPFIFDFVAIRSNKKS